MSTRSQLAPDWFVSYLPPWKVRQVIAQRDFAMRRARWLKENGLEFAYEVRIARESNRTLVKALHS